MDRTPTTRSSVFSSTASSPALYPPAPADGDLRLAGTAALGVLAADDPRLEALRRACALLDSLETERRHLDQRLIAGNRRDPMRIVTGRTSLDEAVDETRALIRQLDELLCQAADAARAAGRTHPKDQK